MTAVYEFHVTGLIGPVVEAAMPELTSQPAPNHTVLIGTGESLDVQRVLATLTAHGLVPDHIVIAPSTRWRGTNRPDIGTDEIGGP